MQELAALKAKQYRGGDGGEQEYMEAVQSSPLYQALLQCHEALVLSSNAQVWMDEVLCCSSVLRSGYRGIRALLVLLLSICFQHTLPLLR